MTSPYGKYVVSRESIEVEKGRYFRKVWDNGYVDTYVRAKDEKVFIQRKSITQEEWDEIAKWRPPHTFEEGQ